MEINPAAPTPVFRQIADEVRRCVAVGVLKPDEPLPAVRRLAADLCVNPNTVQHAYRVLEQEGVVHVRRGLGTYVSATKPESRSAMARKAREIAERALREGYRHGLLASDLLAALADVAPRGDGTPRPSGPGGEQQVRRD